MRGQISKTVRLTGGESLLYPGTNLAFLEAKLHTILGTHFKKKYTKLGTPH